LTAALSIAIYAVFTLLAHFGVLANWITELTNPLNLSFWLDAGLAFSVFLIIVIVLLGVFSAASADAGRPAPGDHQFGTDHPDAA
jgi:hypothetical protein